MATLANQSNRNQRQVRVSFVDSPKDSYQKQRENDSIENQTFPEQIPLTKAKSETKSNIKHVDQYEETIQHKRQSATLIPRQTITKKRLDPMRHSAHDAKPIPILPINDHDILQKFKGATGIQDKKDIEKRIEKLNKKSPNEYDFTFSELKQKFINNTSIEVPFTMTQVEDVMYLKENLIISLQTNFFSSKIASHLLEKDKENTQIFGSQYYNKYQKNEKNKGLSHFNNQIGTYTQSKIIYEKSNIKNEQNDKQDKIKNESNDNYTEKINTQQMTIEDLFLMIVEQQSEQQDKKDVFMQECDKEQI